jgi:hypothetical protein
MTNIVSSQYKFIKPLGKGFNCHPYFFSLPTTGVNPLRGFIRATLRAKGSRPVETLNPGLAVDTPVAKL